MTSARATVTGRRTAMLRERLVARMPSDRVLGWVLPLSIAVVGGILRFWHLRVPKTYVFDETYYAREAWRLLNYGVEYDVEKRAPEYVVHPPLGKWVIAVGEWIFGDNSFGWRFSVAALGVISIVMVARIARRMFRSTLLGAVAGLLLCLDSLHYVMSRTALLDSVLMFFALAAFGALVIDRDRTRARLGRSVIVAPAGRFGPGQGLRPWRLAAGLFLGMACATKWSGLWFVVVFGLMALLWDVGARRAAGVRRPLAGALLRDAAPAFAALVILPLLVYVASWTGWFLSDAEHAYFRTWAAADSGRGWPIPGGDALASLWHYHTEAYSFHVNLHDNHPYKANPWSWLVLGRPISYFYEGPTLGQNGCDVAQCSQAILAVGNPVLWWGAVLALPVLVALWAGRRDWRAGAILAGLVAGYLPWFLYQARTIYYFYAVVFVPFLVLAVTMVLGVILGGPDASPRRRTWGAAVAGSYVLLAVVAFWWLFPVLTAQVIPYNEWQLRIWLPSWV